jgi:flagellar assembly factor FliW
MTLEIETTRFGKVQIPDEKVFSFPRGLIGFEHLKRFALLESAKGPSVQWLQSLDDPGVAFLVSEPGTYLPSYDLRIPGDAPPERLSGLDANRAEIRTILHVDRRTRLLHVHVQAPLLLDPASRKGVQVITDSPEPTVAISLGTP